MSRNTHDLEDSHRNQLPATRVELAATIDTIAAGTTLEDALTTIHSRLIVREAQGTYRKRFTIDATISA